MNSKTTTAVMLALIAAVIALGIYSGLSINQHRQGAVIVYALAGIAMLAGIVICWKRLQRIPDEDES